MDPVSVKFTVHSYSAASTLCGPVYLEQRLQAARNLIITSLSSHARDIPYELKPGEPPLPYFFLNNNKNINNFAFEAPLPSDLSPTKLAVWWYKEQKKPTFLPSEAGTIDPRTLNPFVHHSLPVASTSTAGGKRTKKSPKKILMGPPEIVPGATPKLKKRARFDEKDSPTNVALRRSPRRSQSVDLRTRTREFQVPPLDCGRGQDKEREVQNDSEEGVSPVELPLEDLSVGAIKRCIPRPYRHITSLLVTYEPPRLHEAPIRHSFLDPPLAQTLASTSKPSSIKSTTPSSSSNASAFPLALARLARGRRGSWIIPISSPFQIPHSSPPTWISSSTPSSKSPRPIVWTDARLRCLWIYLTRIHDSGKMGIVDADCVAASSVVGSSLPDHIRIRADAHLALALRALLTLVKVEDMNEEPKQERFLKDPRLVWISESGVPILLA